MGGLLSPLDFVIFFGSLAAIMALGLWAGRKEDSAEDYYLAGKRTRWWGVAGSIFGSNVSANHIVGMMGVGFSIGFVQSHFELGAIAGLLLLCYGFLPVYRKLNVFTLSEYLSRRYNDQSRLAYTVIMVIIIVVIQMVPGFYIGSRALNILLLDEQKFVGENVTVQEQLESSESVLPEARSSEYEPTAPNTASRKIDIARTPYVIGILLMAFVTGTYTIVGGLKAVILTDVIQSILMLVAAVVVAILTFGQPEIGGWRGMLDLDQGQKMSLYLPSDHPDMPWSGVLTGLFVLHFFYWGTNQFIVQRALAARDDRQARLGIIAAGFFKLLIPFISIGTGIAAFYLFSQRMPGLSFDGDTAFPMLMRQVVAPLGFGVVGLVATGLVGAILSSLDSMMNSAATLVTFDIYKRYMNPNATEKQLIRIGRVCIAAFVMGAALLTIFTMDPNSESNFFLLIAEHQSRVVAGLVVAFAGGMMWPRATGAGALAAIVTGIAVSYVLPRIYSDHLAAIPSIQDLFGPQLNYFHTVMLAAIGAALALIAFSLASAPDEERSKLSWTGLELYTTDQLRRTLYNGAATLALYGLLALFVSRQSVSPTGAGLLAGAWIWGLFIRTGILSIGNDQNRRLSLRTILSEDRIWAGLLAGVAVFMLYHYA